MKILWHFMSSYRYYNPQSASTQQVDTGGFFPGDTLSVTNGTVNVSAADAVVCGLAFN
jgi:hypothetical protein